MKEKSYAISNKHETVRLNSFDKTYIQKVLNSGTCANSRAKASQELCNYLCKKFNIPMVEVVVPNIRQNHSTMNGRIKSKTLGQYRVSRNHITVFNLTAARQQVVAIKTFVDVLLHEFLHHYDTHVLKIRSLHTAGFYKRISDLKAKLT